MERPPILLFAKQAVSLKVCDCQLVLMHAQLARTTLSFFYRTGPSSSSVTMKFNDIIYGGGPFEESADDQA